MFNKMRKKEIELVFEGYADLSDIKWREGILLLPHLCKALPYDYETKVRVIIQELPQKGRKG